MNHIQRDKESIKLQNIQSNIVISILIPCNEGELNRVVGGGLKLKFLSLMSLKKMTNDAMTFKPNIYFVGVILRPTRVKFSAQMTPARK